MTKELDKISTKIVLQKKRSDQKKNWFVKFSTKIFCLENLLYNKATDVLWNEKN